MYCLWGYIFYVTVTCSETTWKALHEKVLKATNLYWLHNDALEKNNSLNGNSNEPRINE